MFSHAAMARRLVRVNDDTRLLALLDVRAK